jgi:hypothetical protein
MLPHQNEGVAIMRVHKQKQLNHPVDDEVLALTAVTRPFLKGVLYSLKQDIVCL